MWKRTVTVKVVEAFGILIVLAVGLLIFVEGKLNEISDDKAHLDQLRLMTADARLLQLSVANVWQFFTDASLTKDQRVVDEEARPNYNQAVAALQRIAVQEAGMRTGALGDTGELENSLRRMYQTGDRMFRAYERDWDEGNKVMEEYDQVCDAVIRDVDAQVKNIDAIYNALSEDITRAIHRLFITMLAVVSLIVLSGAFSAFMLARQITRPLHMMLDSIKRLARGDLTHRVEFKDSGDLGELVTSINSLTENLKGIVAEVNAGAANISHGSREIAHGVDDLSQRTEGQSSSLEETASSMEQMTSAVRQSADNAQQMNQLVKIALKEAEEGGSIVTSTVTAMTEIDASSTRIADIIGVIDEIAFQTNLLALNAAVEAARAGEQGKGFAVVAAEVRSLAQRSATAAKEIKGLIVDSVGKVKMGKQLVDQSGETLHKIIASVNKVASNAAEVSIASQEQSAGIEQINKAVMQMDEMTQQNAALVEQASAATRAMEEQAHKLVERISYFKLDRSGGVVAAAGKETRFGARHGLIQDRPADAAAV